MKNKVLKRKSTAHRNGFFTSALQKELLAQMIRIRAAEEKIVEVYPQQEIRTPTHLSIGQEAVAVGVCAALKKKDQLFASHRCHATYLAKGGTSAAFFAELCGRESGSNRGRIGSAHLSDHEFGVYASPILGAMIPVAVGAALAFQMDGKPNVTVAFFGDAAIEEGVFAESFNFAVVRKLPILFVCENNYFSTHSHLSERQPPSPIFNRVSIPELKAEQIDGNDVEKVYQTASRLIQTCRNGKGPAFLECLTYRIMEHVGPLFDYDKGYRSPKDLELWKKKCPIARYKKQLVQNKVFSAKDIQTIEQNFQKEADAAYQSALQKPWPSSEELVRDVY